MKAVTRQQHFLNFNKPLQLCERFFLKLFSRLQSWGSSVSMHVQMTRFPNFDLQAALLIFLDFLAAYLTRLSNASKEAWINKRFRVGVLVGLVAFPAWKSHLFFDINTRIDYWYYTNYVFYFNSIRFFLAGIFLTIGGFLVAPQKWAFRWFALPILLLCVTEIYERSYYDDYMDFQQAMPTWQVAVIGLSTILPFCFAIDYLIYRKYHLHDGNVARVKGIIKTPGIDVNKKMELLEQLIEESENYNARI